MCVSSYMFFSLSLSLCVGLFEGFVFVCGACNVNAYPQW